MDKNTKRQELWTDKLIKQIYKYKKARVMDRQSYQIDSQEQKKHELWTDKHIKQIY